MSTPNLANRLHIHIYDMQLAAKQVIPSGVRNGDVVGREMPQQEMSLLREGFIKAQIALRRVLPSDFNLRGAAGKLSIHFPILMMTNLFSLH